MAKNYNTTSSKTLETLGKLKSTIFLLIGLVVLCYIGYVCYQIFTGIMEQVNEYLGKKDIKLSKDKMHLSVKAVPRDQVQEYSERIARKAMNSMAANKATDDEIPRFVQFKEWKDRRRKVFHGTGCQAANEGFF